MPRSWLRSTASTVLLFLVLISRPAFAQSDAVAVEVERWGIGDTIRGGDICGLKLVLTLDPASSFETAIGAAVQWEVPNADGDIGEYRRTISLTKGVPTPVWLYAPIPPSVDPANQWLIRVFEYADGSRGREIGGARINPPQPTSLTDSVIAVAGGTAAGLDGYSFMTTRLPNGRTITPGPEHTRVVRGLRAGDLPDHWSGYHMLEALVWTELPPADLSLNQIDAVRRWVQGGGHLVISLPETGNPWGLGDAAANDLADLLPTRAPREVVDLEVDALLPLLTKSRAVVAGVDALDVKVFRDTDGFDVIDAPYEPHVWLPDGRVLGIQRSFGHGRITILGIDLADRRLASATLDNELRHGLPEADVFWNRILGRRQDTLDAEEVAALADAQLLNPNRPNIATAGSSLLVEEQVKHSEEAGKGLAAAILLFIVYWFIAGPVGFALLRQKQNVRHAWLAFAGAGLVFTGLAWSSVRVLRENDLQLRHLTFLDYVARDPSEPVRAGDPQLARAVSWLSLYAPGYGTTPLEFAEETDPEARGYQRELLVSWSPPPAGALLTFPNVDRYTVPVGPSDGRTVSFDLPRRSTASQMYAEWIGAIPERMGGLLYSDPDDPLRVSYKRDSVTGGLTEELRGTVRVDLPVELERVLIIWVRNNRIDARDYETDDAGENKWSRFMQAGRGLNSGLAWSAAPGAITDRIRFHFAEGEIAGAFNIDTFSGTQLDTLFDTRFTKQFTNGWQPTGALTADESDSFLQLLSLFHAVKPPIYRKASERASGVETVRFERFLGRSADLSSWLSRPCVIIMGFLRNSECPLPLVADGETPPSVGTTMIRWIHPLPVAPPALAQSETAE